MHKVIDLRRYVVAVLEKKYGIQCYLYGNPTEFLVRLHNEKKRERKIRWAPLANG